MIEIPWMLLRLAVGLGSIEVAGYALLVLMLPRRSTFTPMERLALAFGLGSLGHHPLDAHAHLFPDILFFGIYCRSLAVVGPPRRLAGLATWLAPGGLPLFFDQRAYPGNLWI